MEAERRHTHSVTLPGEQLVPAYTPQESAYLESNIGVSSQHLNNNNNNHMKPHHPHHQPGFPVGYIQPQHLISLQGSHAATSQSLPKYLADPAPSPASLEMAQLAAVAAAHRGNLTTPRRVARSRQERCVEVGVMRRGDLTRGMTRVPAATWATGQYSAHYGHAHSHRSSKGAGQGAASWWRCWMLFLCSVAQTLLHGLLGVLLYWLLRYRAQQLLVPFVWLGPGSGASSLLLENTHALLTLTGTIYCTGQAVLVYVFSSCCRPGCSRLLHLLFQALGAGCLGLGLASSWELDTRTQSHLVTMHSWTGAAAAGLVIVQLVFGLVSFSVVQCHRAEAAGYKAAVLPLHRALGLATFLLAVAAAVTGITQTERRGEGNLVVASNSTSMYEALLFNGLQEEGLVVNLLGLIMILLSVMLPLIIACNQRKNNG